MDSPNSAVNAESRYRPPLLIAVVVSVTLQALLLLIAAVVILVAAREPGGLPMGPAVATAAFAAVVAAALAWFARGLWAGRRWARAPVVTWCLLVTLSLLSSGMAWSAVGAAALVLVIATVVAMMTGPVARATSSTAEPPVT